MTMAQIPDSMRDIVHLLANGSSDDVKIILPTDLDRLRKVSSSGEEKAKEVTEKFSVVIATLHELVEAVQRARGDAEQAQKIAHHRLEKAEKEREFLDEQLAKAEDEREKIDEKVKQETEEFKAELDKAGSDGE